MRSLDKMSGLISRPFLFHASLIYAGLSIASLIKSILSRAALYYSHISSRQFGGMIPSRRADAIMPRCLLSARKT